MHAATWSHSDYNINIAPAPLIAPHMAWFASKGKPIVV